MKVKQMDWIDYGRTVEAETPVGTYEVVYTNFPSKKYYCLFNNEQLNCLTEDSQCALDYCQRHFEQIIKECLED